MIIFLPSLLTVTVWDNEVRSDIEAVSNRLFTAEGSFSLRILSANTVVDMTRTICPVSHGTKNKKEALLWY